MDEWIQGLRKNLVDYGGESGQDHLFMQRIVFVDMYNRNELGLLDRESVFAVLKLVAEFVGFNRYLWESINSAPTNESVWSQMMFLGSGGNDTWYKVRYRYAVEKVRDTFGELQMRRHRLFHD